MLFKTSIKKCFILTALLMLLTGCTINYNLTIDNNSVSESISGRYSGSPLLVLPSHRVAATVAFADTNIFY